MCGIFGLISKRKDINVAQLIREGLERMEYRGYDSAGIALVNNGKIELRKKAGRIADINADGWFDKMPGQFGVGHTRWATHGPPIANNSHPHMDCTGKIALVHNGIIENYQDLRRKLTERGHKLVSETDTEVFPHLIEEFRKTGLDLKDSVIETVKLCKGAYGVVVCDADNPEYMVVARKESPLVIGITEDETTYCGSDIPAFLPLTRNAIILDDNEVAVLYPGKCEIFHVDDGEKAKREIFTVDYSMDAAQKVLDGKEYKWFMHKEMHEIPRKIIDQVRMPQEHLDEFAQAILNADHVFITAAGTAYYAAIAGKYQITKFGGPYIQGILCSELVDALPTIPPNSVLIAVSQSGETADTIEAVRYAKEQFGVKICSVVNVVGSSLTRYSDHVIITTAGPEIAVASQKAYCTQVTALSMVALKIATLTNTLTTDEIEKYESALLDTAEACALILKDEKSLINLAHKIAYKSNLYFLARGISTSAAFEGALKLKEIAYIHTEAYAAGESKHGPIALIEEGFPCVFITPPDQTYPKIIGNVMEMKSRGAMIISVVADYDVNISEISHHTIRVPIKNNKYAIAMSIVPFVLPLQMLAYFVSDYKGFDPDKPKNLAKSVTVK
ncbi:Glutamine--fructose-6-phosphate aminotransferase [isomerizing] [Candidatus Lokiarchaeum ossiferum]|uniref:glutamine--fructose-6-phosphate transaminase (isomerizing) n=1 Tax=Candidatus Lokiarchaeum ossiferum TaxID=2951803 RepID=A0ABY6HSU1_9ARCH|nr:Glutamine--fructose-6-phosphate aminotransferase [isomerizing] [Candidatus Lokiarchaeum sp. B-35]